MGGTAAGFQTALAEDQQPIDNPQDVEEAIAYANEALQAAGALEEMADNIDPYDPTALDLEKLDVAVENYIDQFNIPSIALESDDDDEASNGKTGRLKKVVLYLYALVERVFKALFDFFSNQKLVARRVMPKTREYIGRSDSLSASVGAQLSIKDRGIMVALHVDGIAPKKTPELFDALVEQFEQQYRYSPVPEVVRLVSAAKAKDEKRTVVEAEALRDKLENGLKNSLEKTDPEKFSFFPTKVVDGTDYYVSQPLFGQNYIAGNISHDVTDKGTFTFNCGVRRDAEVPLRVSSFPVLGPEEIRHICRTALRASESIIRFSRDEELLKKALREAAFVTSKEPDQSSVIALRNMAAVGQNSYIVYLRFVSRSMQALMRWCAQSITKYEEVGK